MDLQTIRTMSKEEAVQRALKIARDLNFCPLTLDCMETGEDSEDGAKFLLELYYLDGGAEKVRQMERGIRKISLGD